MTFRSLLALLTTIPLGLTACSGTRHVSGPEFMRIKKRLRASSLDLPDTFTARANGKVFYYEETMRLFGPGTRRRLYWAWMKELPPSEIANIRAGRNGWDGRPTASEETVKSPSAGLRFLDPQK